MLYQFKLNIAIFFVFQLLENFHQQKLIIAIVGGLLTWPLRIQSYQKSIRAILYNKTKRYL